jgi:hypothetical protein
MAHKRPRWPWIAIATVTIASSLFGGATVDSSSLKQVGAGSRGALPATAQAAPPAGQAALPPQARVFTGDVGILVNYIKPDKAADFEILIGKLKEALAKSDRPERLAQAAGWRVLKMTEPMPNGNIVYLFLLEPVAKDTDYSPSRILGEAFPEELADLFKRYSESFAGGVTLSNYKVIASMK